MGTMGNVRVSVGWDRDEYGTITATADGLVLSGDKAQLRETIRSMRRVWSDELHRMVELSDEELVRSLPYRLRNRGWACFVDASGKNPDQGVDEPPWDRPNPWATARASR